MLEHGPVEVMRVGVVFSISLGQRAICIEDVHQQGGARPQSVAGLMEIHGPRVAVDGGGNLARYAVSWKGVQDRRVRSHLIDSFGSQPIVCHVGRCKELVIFLIIVFLLNSRHVEAIDLVQNRDSVKAHVQRIDLLKRNSAVAQSADQIFTELKLRMVGRDKHHRHMVVFYQQLDQRTNGSATSQVTAERVSLVRDICGEVGVTVAQHFKTGARGPFFIDKPKGAADGIEIQQRLG